MEEDRGRGRRLNRVEIAVDVFKTQQNIQNMKINAYFPLQLTELVATEVTDSTELSELK